MQVIDFAVSYLATGGEGMSKYKLVTVKNEELDFGVRLVEQMESAKERWLSAVKHETERDQAIAFTDEERQTIDKAVFEMAKALGVQKQLRSILDVLESRAARVAAQDENGLTVEQETKP